MRLSTICMVFLLSRSIKHILNQLKENGKTCSKASFSPEHRSEREVSSWIGGHLETSRCLWLPCGYPIHLDNISDMKSCLAGRLAYMTEAFSRLGFLPPNKDPNCRAILRSDVRFPLV